MAVQQLIDADGSFTGGLPSSSAAPDTLNYGTVAIVGCQSGGKSTLLNSAFDTRFPVLDASKTGRRRTTLGVWGAVAAEPDSSSSSLSSTSPQPATCAAATTHPLIVLDVEGTDSRERGEGAKAFESRTTLLTLALADCVLVNMWAHDIGRYSAANYELLETVFAHTVALRRSGTLPVSKPVSLLIVVRDHDGESSLDDIRRVLTGDLLNIWQGLRISDMSFATLFRMDVVLLPHMLYARDVFKTRVRELARRVAAETGADGGGGGARKLVPLAAFDALAHSVWEAVCRFTGGDGPNADFSLDLPRHATLATYFRAGEVGAGVWAGPVGQRLDDLRAEIETHWQKPVAEYGERVAAIARDALAEFDAAAAAYARGGKQAGEAVARRRAELGVELVSRVLDVRDRYLSVCRESCMNGFDDAFRPLLGGTRGYQRNAMRLARSFVAQYRKLMLGARLPSVVAPFVELRDTELRRAEAEAAETDGDDEREDGGVEFADNFDALDVELGLVDDGQEDGDEYSVERFRREVLQKVDERKRLGDVMLPGGGGSGVMDGPKPEPWWKGLLIRAAILLINYMQATQGQRAAVRQHRQHERDYPASPSF